MGLFIGIQLGINRNLRFKRKDILELKRVKECGILNIKYTIAFI